MSEVRRLGSEDVGAAADAIQAGHADYPAFVTAFPEPRRRARALRTFFAMTVADGVRHGEVWGEGTERLDAVAVWLPPGAFPWSAARKLRSVPALARVAWIYPSRAAAFARYGANAEHEHPSEPHWYLVVLSVRPDAQRGGLGSALVSKGLEMAETDRVACYLETSDPANVGYYQRFGFEVIGTPTLVPGGAPHTAMRRPPG